MFNTAPVKCLQPLATRILWQAIRSKAVACGFSLSTDRAVDLVLIFPVTDLHTHTRSTTEKRSVDYTEDHKYDMLTPLADWLPTLRRGGIDRVPPEDVRVIWQWRPNRG